MNIRRWSSAITPALVLSTPASPPATPQGTAKATKKYAADGGQCLFPVSYQVRNIGQQPSGKFTVLFATGATDVTADSFDSIPPGGVVTKVLTVVFKGGAQSLGLKVDGLLPALTLERQGFGISLMSLPS